jgi:hypothetical protein
LNLAALAAARRLSLCDVPLSLQQLNVAFHLPQGKMSGADAAKPEILNALLFREKAKEPSSIQTHEQFGAFRVGAL